MARLFTSGFETGDISEWTEAGAGSSKISIQTGTVLYGTYALYCNPSNTGNAYLRYQFSGSEQNGPYYSRFYFRKPSNPTTATIIFCIIGWITEGNAYFYLNTNGTLDIAQSNDDVIGTTGVLDNDRWYEIELYVKRVSDGNDEITAKLDGIIFGTSTTATINGPLNSILVGSYGLNKTLELYFDDIALNDSTGTINNSWVSNYTGPLPAFRKP